MKTVLCHGTFDVLHVGHVMHLAAARNLGDRLVVSITADVFVAKGPGRPVFNEQERFVMLAALRDVDEVYICWGTSGVGAIMRYLPAVYVKGIDYACRGIVAAELEACRAVGAEVRYTSTRKYSSTALLEHFR